MLLLLAAVMVLSQQPEPPVRLQGQVIDSRGEPVPAAEVWATDPAGAVKVRGRSDGEGRYQLQFASVPQCTLHATATGRTQAVAMIYLPLAGERCMTLRLWDAVTVRGCVTDAAGKPVAGAEVVAVPTRSRGLAIEPVEARTGADGRYELPHAPPGSVWLGATTSGQTMVERTAWLGRGGTEDFSFPDRPARRLSVRVSGVAPADAAGAMVLVRRNTGSGDGMSVTYSRGLFDASGRFELSGLPDGSVQIVVLDPRMRWWCRPANWEARDSGQLEPAATPYTNCEWRVALVGPDGQPVAGERLLLDLGGTRRVVTTSDRGEASITAPCQGEPWYAAQLVDSPRWTLAVSEFPGAPTLGPRLWTRGEAPARLQARPSASVRGQVVANDGAPRAYADVILEEWAPNYDPNWHPVATARADARGRFAMLGLFDGGKPQRLRLPRTRSLVAAPALTQGEEGVPGVVIAAPAGSIEGVVLDDSGQPLPGARVLLLQDQQVGCDTAELLADVHGRFQLAPAAEGRWHLHLFWPGKSQAQEIGAPFEVKLGEVTVVEFEAKRD